MNALKLAVLAFLSSFGSAFSPAPSPKPLDESESIRFSRTGRKGMIVADDEQSAELGAQVLRKGGNAIDAAVATAFGMAVTRPHFASLGGGGFLVFCPSPKSNRNGSCSVVDFREMAPSAATRDMYLKEGKAIANLSRNGALASGVPGVTAGLLYALEKFGTKNRKELLANPIRWAKNGITVSTHTETAANRRWSNMNEAAKKIFGCGHAVEGPCRSGELLKQADLARVMQAISDHGASGFYKGSWAQKMVSEIRKEKGILTQQDFETYTPKERSPVRGFYKGYEVVTMPPPSSGGTVLLQMLAFMERADSSGQMKAGFGSVASIHAQLHAMTLAFADRAQHMGDPDFHPVPVNQLLATNYLNDRWKSFDSTKANLNVSSGSPAPEPTHTTHFSAMDASGNAVAVTLTVNDYFGSGFVAPGTGVVMNNQMDDFSAQPGVPNLFGLVGAEANAITPGKRPLSSMSPTIVRDMDGNNRIVLGAAGGPKIITSVFQTLVNRLQFDMPLADAVAAPRIHHQWKPLIVRVENNGLSSETREKLTTMGYAIESGGGLGVVHSLERFASGRIVGVPDPRGEGSAVAE